MSPRTRTRTRGLAALATATMIVALGGCASERRVRRHDAELLPVQG